MSELAQQLIAENKKTRATTLDLGNCGLTEVPEEVGDCVWLETLILSSEWGEYAYGKPDVTIRSTNTGAKNKITALPLAIGRLQRLRIIVFFQNPVEDLLALAGLSKLQQISCSDTHVGDLSPLCDLVNLRYLDCNKSPVRDLSPIAGLTSLEVLYCGNTNVYELAPLRLLTNLRELACWRTQVADLEPIASLRNLEKLSCWETQVYDLTPLGGLVNLHMLDCSFTKISNLSPILPFLKNGIQIKVDGYVSHNEFDFAYCEITNPPLDVVKQGNDAILEYFRQKEASGAAPLLEAKLILLGDGRAGKTSLANRLIRKPLPGEADRTQGVDIVIGEYAFPVPGERVFKLNIWDFAGQDKYKALHQFFYTESSLYVLVAESGNTGTDFDDWLQTAELFGEGSPLLLVLNEFRDGIGLGAFDPEHWKKRFPNLLKEVFSVNLGTQRGFETLEQHIRLLAQTLPHTRHEFPNSWAAVRHELEQRRDEQFISLAEYLNVCRRHGLPERHSALVLSSVLHKIGVCLHYQQSDLLKQIVILKNEWATEAVYKILEDPAVAGVKKGFFERADLDRIWSEDAYCDMRPQLLELMQQFKMAYPLPGQQAFVTPPLLPPAPPADWQWPEADALEFYIEYEFLPKALLTQFIVTRHADIDQGKTLVWRNGVVLRWPGEALAEVSKTKLQGRDAFYIRSQGRDRKGLLTVILKTFRDLHAEYRGIRWEEKVPCPCAGCREGANKQHYFDFENLKNRLEKGRRQVECDKSLEELEVLPLLENHFVFEQLKTGQPLLLKQDIGGSPPSEPRIRRIFLASSAELKPERERIEIEVNRLNKQLLDQGVFLFLSLWEDAQYVGQSFRSQDDYNQEVEACDIFVLLFHSKLGKYTREELNLAQKRHA
ncbi:MAG: hypothetical protein IT260_02305, partial [Saprospiraceae bacterium]|nr:hypothetical protein [Saprospiraceae bacterium]